MFNAAINDDPTVYAIPIFIACILVEAFIDFRSRTNLYHKKDSAASISMGLGVVVIGLVTKTFYFFVFSLIYQFRIFELETRAIGHSSLTIEIFLSGIRRSGSKKFFSPNPSQF